MSRQFSPFYPFRPFRVASFFLVAAFCLLSVSCVTGSYRDRGSLSDAMDKARDDNEGSSSVPDRPRYPERDRDRYPERDRDRWVEEDRAASASSSPELNLSSFNYGVRGSTSFMASGDQGSDWACDLVLLAGLSESMDLDLFLGLKTVTPKTGSDIDLSVDGNLYFFRVGGDVSFYPLPERRFLSPFVTVGLGGFIMAWSFENALYSKSETIKSDSLGGAFLQCGAGLYLYRGERLRLSVGANPEVYFFGTMTTEGFNNDYFSPMGSVNARVELLF